MRLRCPKSIIACFVLALSASGVRAADEFAIDAAHSSVYFKVSHGGFSDLHGRFNSFSGKFAIDADPSKSSFELTIKADSVDTGNQGRDGHLRNPDFFNTQQYPAITFKSTSVKAGKDGLDVTGDLTMHGKTKPVSFTLKGGKTAPDRDSVRTGYSTVFSLKRSDFDMSKMLDAIGDEVHVSIGIEGTKKK